MVGLGYKYDGGWIKNHLPATVRIIRHSIPFLSLFINSYDTSMALRRAIAAAMVLLTCLSGSYAVSSSSGDKRMLRF